MATLGLFTPRDTNQHSGATFSGFLCAMFQAWGETAFPELVLG